MSIIFPSLHARSMGPGHGPVRVSACEGVLHLNFEFSQISMRSRFIANGTHKSSVETVGAHNKPIHNSSRSCVN